jgi:transcriptional regulator with XRE-family HTH domain
MEHAEVIRRLRREVELTGSVRRVAGLLNVSPQYMSAVLNDERAIGPKLLKALKLRRRVVKTVTYEEVSRGRRRA